MQHFFAWIFLLAQVGAEPVKGVAFEKAEFAFSAGYSETAMEFDLWNNPITGWDVLGLFGAGTPGGYLGHGQFPTPDGSRVTRGSNFDYNMEDDDKETEPIRHPKGHFLPLEISEKDVDRAVKECKYDPYRRAAHRGQDYYSHYAKNQRWAPFQTWNNLGFGHFFQGTFPDQDNNAWVKADNWTKKQNIKWNKNCCKKKDGSWTKKSSGCCVK